MTIKAYVQHIHVHVKPGAENAFIKASLLIASESLQEEGVTGFDLLQRAEDPTSFVIAQGFASRGAETAHRATDHYEVWRKAIDDLVVDPRITVRYLQQ